MRFKHDQKGLSTISVVESHVMLYLTTNWKAAHPCCDAISCSVGGHLGKTLHSSQWATFLVSFAQLTFVRTQQYFLPYSSKKTYQEFRRMSLGCSFPLRSFIANTTSSSLFINVVSSFGENRTISSELDALSSGIETCIEESNSDRPLACIDILVI